MRSLVRIAARARGASLLELMVAMSVAAVLLGAAIPSYIDFSVRNRLVSYSNELIATINLARSEAIRRGATVSICPTNDNANCSGNWNEGWLIFVNDNADDPATVDAGERLIKTFPGLSDNFAVGTDAALARDLTYGPDGAARAIGAISVCHNSELEGARAIVVTRLRPRVARDSDADKIPNIDDGTDMVGCANPSG